MDKRVNFVFWLVILFSIPQKIFAQDDLLDLLNAENKKETTDYTYATFKTTRIIHGQSVETIPAGNLNFIIQHRFGKINDGYYQFFGLDQATMRLGFEYGIFNSLTIGIGRSTYYKTVDGYLKYKILRQSSGKRNFPFSVVLFSGIAMDGMKWENPERTNYFSSRLMYSYEILIGRKFNNTFSLQLMPGLVHRNFVVATTDPNDTYSVGIGGRIKITNRTSFNAEYYYRIPGTEQAGTYNSIAIGFDIETGGHIFQLQITNSKGMIEPYLITATSGDVMKGDIYFGFNINRIFTLKKKPE